MSVVTVVCFMKDLEELSNHRSPHIFVKMMATNNALFSTLCLHDELQEGSDKLSIDNIMSYKRDLFILDILIKTCHYVINTCLMGVA